MSEPICPIDCGHTMRERERIKRRFNADGTRKRDIDWEDPMVQAMGPPEAYR